MKNALSSLVVFCIVAAAFAVRAGEMVSSKEYRCPVCGMYVSMFPDWNSRIEFKDSTVAIFDGSKDMFKYYLDIKKYNPSKGMSDVSAVLVKDYYSTADIDARQAYFVIWSDVYGPMGHEPIPFENEADAKDFLKEHKGRGILRFNDINEKLIMLLDNPPD